ncbi:sensor histidine kinase [Streptomyces sp. NPDC056987]|uniref:sensor histidine kinase n=1 Tax=Streptomyces sp. NPDC056987 TaxID=3345988 RepID=UPI00363D91FB
MAVLVVAVFCVPDLINGGAVDGDAPRTVRAAFTELPVPGMLALQSGLVLPLVWRRRRPWLVFTIIFAFFVVQWALGAVLRADVALIIALPNLALRGRIRQLPWACGAVLGAMVLVTLRVSTVISAWFALFFLLSAPTAALALGFAMRIRRAQLAGLRERAARLETERDQRSRLAVAVERARVAREMHDVVGHNLSVVITFADAGAYATDVTPHRSKEALVLIGDTGRQALDELRRVLGLLRDTREGHSNEVELSPQPGITDIDELCDGVRAAGLDVVYRRGAWTGGNA